MDKKRRTQIRKCNESLVAIKETLDTLLEKEEECLGNMPESLEGTDRYGEMEEAIDSLTDATSCIDDAISSLDNI